VLFIEIKLPLEWVGGCFDFQKEKDLKQMKVLSKEGCLFVIF